MNLFTMHCGDSDFLASLGGPKVPKKYNHFMMNSWFKVRLRSPGRGNASLFDVPNSDCVCVCFVQVSIATVCVRKDAGDPTAPTAAPVSTEAPAPRRTAPVCALPVTVAPAADEVKKYFTQKHRAAHTQCGPAGGNSSDQDSSSQTVLVFKCT